MKKFLNALLLICSLFGYMEWPKDNSIFLFQLEYDLLWKQHYSQFIHPLILIPLVGQLILIYTLVQRTPSRWLSFVGIGCLSTIMLVLLFIGIIQPNIKMIICSLPFCMVAIITIVHHNKHRHN